MFDFRALSVILCIESWGKMIFKRKIYDELLEWKNESKGRTALLVEGARRVGKSFIVKEFGKKEYQSYILIDFSKEDKNIMQMFEDNSGDLNNLFLLLEVYFNTKLYERNSLIVFDEVQLYPFARQLIKHLVADGRYDYIETGSLLSIKTNVQDILIPSEERSILMNPFDFEEFLWAIGETLTYNLIRDFYNERKPLGNLVHQAIMKKFKLYMLVGGMPQAILKYVETHDFDEVEREKHEILTLYKKDIVKFARGYENNVINVFNNIPSELSKPYKRFNLASVNKNFRFRSLEDSFIWLEEAKVVNLSFNSLDPNIGLRMNLDDRAMKLYMSDTGLLITHSINDQSYVDSDIYKALLHGALNINEGMFAENVVAQLLVANNHKLFFYSKRDMENKNNHMEVDFLITKGNKVIPIEVKSGNYRRHSSLDKFKIKFSKRVTKVVILHTKDLNVKGETLYLPLYMAGLL